MNAKLIRELFDEVLGDYRDKSTAVAQEFSADPDSKMKEVDEMVKRWRDRLEAALADASNTTRL